MNDRAPNRGFASRPGDQESWIKAPDVPPARVGDPAAYSARLTIDVTPELRGRLKIIAFQRGVTVAGMLRDLLAREFPADSGTSS